MKITDIELIRVAVPRRRTHKMASMATAAGRFVILRLHTDDGITGLGEATVMREWGGDHGKYYGESPGTTLTVIQEDLFPAIRGRDPREVEQILEVMDRTIKGYPYAKAAIDLALHDIIGKASGLPAHQFLGGSYRDRIPLAQSLGIMETAQAVAEAVEAMGEGIRTIKIKVGLDYAHDEEVAHRLFMPGARRNDATTSREAGAARPRSGRCREGWGRGSRSGRHGSTGSWPGGARAHRSSRSPGRGSRPGRTPGSGPTCPSRMPRWRPRTSCGR